MNPENGCPTGGGPTKGMSCNGGIRGGGVPVGLAGLLKGAGASDPSGPGAAVVDWMFCLVVWWWPMLLSHSKRKLQRKCTKAVALSNQLNLP